MTGKKVLRVVLTLVLLAPASFILTLLLYPLWSWIESTFGIEAVGHASFAEWCYVATYLAIAFLWLAFTFVWWVFTFSKK